MQLGEKDEKELGRLAEEIDAITQKLRAFIQKKGHFVGIQLSIEYRALHERIEDLQKEFDSIPRQHL